ncbi:L7Ae/L30e/S12e/Gadd45 family ribosomal protein [Papillibacter cinnamivorans]|uniref:Ribosomal protein L7Ae n=1 Tax=Papillibacter cinnamivorans DSM 12816 TaxID=1122930 RepID=A0A1W2BL55_9FIRM|nr:ribosomal L7Ae/L30e/S12e/Gadd45 family protein [Papillibacter cinnamivorans]SMC73288.1 Ribosomal protein L7Ae [Papillibacter cinnamivorans DSM 12816]
MNKALSWIGLAKKAGTLAAGEEPVGAAARAHTAKLVAVASDAAENTCRRAKHFAEAGGAAFMGVPFTKAELGSVIGRGSCAVFALTDAVFAANLAEKLAGEDPAGYASQAESLAELARRVQQRKLESRLHEKNKKLGTGKKRAPRNGARRKPGKD